MSAREEQPATVPPPAGEDDAYSATTKVGAMPADIMEKLRAEGLLPEDAASDRETPLTSMRPSTSLEKRQTPVVSVPPVSDGAPVPQLYSTAPPAPPGEATTGDTGDEERGPPSKILTAKPALPETAVAEAIETPVAFAFPPVPKVGEPAADEPSEEEKDTTAPSLRRMEGGQKLTEKAAAQPPSKTTMYVVAVVVVLLLIVALMRLRG